MTLRQMLIITAEVAFVAGVVLAATWILDQSSVFWDKVGHLAAVAQLIGLVGVFLGVPALLIVLDRQRRALESLAQKPLFEIGFDPRGEDTDLAEPVLPIAAHWRDGEELSEPVRFNIRTRNVGTVTAREVFVSYRFPERIALIEPSEHVRREGPENVLEVRQPYLLPTARIRSKLEIRLPRLDHGAPVQVAVTVQALDVEVRRELITLRVN